MFWLAILNYTKKLGRLFTNVFRYGSQNLREIWFCKFSIRYFWHGSIRYWSKQQAGRSGKNEPDKRYLQTHKLWKNEKIIQWLLVLQENYSKSHGSDCLWRSQVFLLKNIRIDIPIVSCTSLKKFFCGTKALERHCWY